MELSSNKAAFGSSSILGFLGTLFISLFEDDRLSLWYGKFFIAFPKLPLFISVIILVVAYYCIYMAFVIKNDNKKLSNELSIQEKRFQAKIEQMENKHEKDIRRIQELNAQQLSSRNEENREKENSYKNTIAELSRKLGEAKRDYELEKIRSQEKNKENRNLLERISMQENETQDLKKIVDDSRILLKEKENEVEKFKEEKKKLYSVDLGQKWDHNVLIIDDDAKTVDKIRRKLQGMGLHVDTALEIPDHRFASDYEIIISDVFQCAPAEEATSILNIIKEKYPYKFVYAMSMQPAACQGLEVDGRIIQKDNEYKFLSEIIQIIRESCKKLDGIDEHWKNVEKTLRLKNTSESLITNIKAFYYNFVKRMQIYY